MFSLKIKKLVATILIVAMVLSSTSFSVFADSVDNYASSAASNEEVKNYFEYEKTTTVEEPKEDETTTVEEPKEDESTIVEESEEDETTTVEEPKEDESTTVEESEEDETTTTVAEQEEDETTTTEVEKEENETTTTIASSDDSSEGENDNASANENEGESDKVGASDPVGASDSVEASDSVGASSASPIVEEETATNSETTNNKITEAETDNTSETSITATSSNIDFDLSTISVVDNNLFGGGLFGAGEHTVYYYFEDAGNTILHLTNNNGGGAYAEFPEQGLNAWTSSQRSNITKVVIDNEIKPITCSCWFYRGENISTISNISNLNVASATNLIYMFCGCASLTSLDLSSFDTSNVTNMSYMFYYCPSLTNLNLSSFDTSNVTDMSYMFCWCDNLTSLDLSSFDTSKVTDMSDMFSPCSSLTNLNLSSFDTSAVVYMEEMFYGCRSLTSLDLSSFDTSKARNMNAMFYGCSNIRNIIVSADFNVSNMSYSSGMFRGCTSLAGGCGTTLASVSYVTDKTYARIDGGVSNPGYFSGNAVTPVTPVPSEVYYYFEDAGETILHLTNNDGGGAYAGFPVYGLNSWTSSQRSKITKVVIDNEIKPVTCARWFYRGENISTISNISNLNVASAIDLSCMFIECRSLTSLDLSSFNTSKVANMSDMFGQCDNLTSLDLSSFDTSNVTYMNAMFYGCSNIRNIIVSADFNVSNVINSPDMFLRCTSLAGGCGTTLASVSNVTDKTYARIDGGVSNPGYFSGNAVTPVTPVPSDTIPNIGEVYYYFEDAGETILHLTNNDNSGAYAEFPERGLDAWTYSQRSKITKVVIDNEIKPITCARWFLGGDSISTISNISNLNVASASSFYAMFSHCSSLTSLDLSSFDTSAVTTMRDMFYNCLSLTNLNLSSFDTIAVVDMSQMFYQCSNLTNLNLSSFDTSAVTTMRNMFYNCNNLTSLDLSSFDTSNVTDMAKMFYNCSSLTNLNLSSFDTSNVTDMELMFFICSNIRNIIVSVDFNVSNVGSSFDMFTGCTSLTGGCGTTLASVGNVTDKTYARIDGGVSNPGYFTSDRDFVIPKNWFNSITLNRGDLTKLTIERSIPTVYDELNYIPDSNGLQISRQGTEVTIHAVRNNNINLPQDSSRLFYNYVNLTRIDGLELASTSNVTNMSEMFLGCNRLTSINLSNFNIENVTDFSHMFQLCIDLPNIDLSSFNTRSARNMECMFLGCENITNIDVSSFDTSLVTSMRDMFCGCSRLSSIDLSNFRSDMLTDISGMFASCRALTNVTLGANFDCANVTDFSGAFQLCASIQTIDLSNIRTMSATDFSYMFSSCTSLTNINFTPTIFDTSNLTDVSYMFNNCMSLTSVTLPSISSFGDSVVTAEGMFRRCTGLTSVDITTFNTSSVSNCKYMFKDCSALTTLNLNNFITESLTDSSQMFEGCSALTTIYASYDFDATNIITSTGMFNNCNNLVGGDGTIYDANFVDKTYAKVDGSYDRPGYFTANPWTVTLNSSGGTFANGSSTKNVNVYKEVSTGRFEKPTKEGYVFDKYYNGTTVINDTWTYGDSVSQVVAHYIPNNYTVRYNANGGKGTMGVDIATYGETYKIKAPTYKNEGYSFAGWTYAGNTYGANTEVSNLTSKKDGEVIFVANWGPKSTTINYYANGGTGNMPSKNFTYGNDATLDPCTFTKEGYTFNGWALSAKADATLGDEATIFAEETYREVIDVYATWINNQVIYGTLELNGNGGYINGVAVYKRYYEEGEQIKDVTKYRRGYDFANWLDNADAITTYPTVCNFTNTLTLTADWSQQIHKVNSGNDTPPRGGGGTGGGGGAGGIYNREINFVIQTPVEENEYSFTKDLNGKRIGILISERSKVSKALLLSSETKDYYQLMSNGNLQLKGGGLVKLKLDGIERYFAVDNNGNIMTGFVVTSDRTKYITVNADYSIKKTFEEKGGKYYLYEADGIYRGMLWNQPIVIAKILYTFDTQGRVISTIDTSVGQGIWEYSPTENKWKFFTTDINGQVMYYKDGVYDILYNNEVLKFGFDKDGNMLTGIYNLNGVTYYSKDSGTYAGAINNI